MIDKFNFYDVYGYLLPGAVLLLLLWLPFGLLRSIWPASDLGSAVFGVVLAYVAGHLLQMFATKIIPSSVAMGKDGPRYPSDVVVDLDNKSLSKEFKTNLAALVKKKFDLDIGLDKPQSNAIDMVRRDAFFLARHALIRAKEVSYAEQFQGMYSLTRGLTVALAIAFVNYIGWSVGTLHGGALDCVVIVVITVGLLAACNFAAQLLRKDLGPNTPLRLERLSALFLLLASMGLGYGMGRRYDVTLIQAGGLALCAMGSLLACLRSYSAYKFFGNNFAITVWRDFFASTDKEQKPAAIDV